MNELAKRLRSEELRSVSEKARSKRGTRGYHGSSCISSGYKHWMLGIVALSVMLAMSVSVAAISGYSSVVPQYNQPSFQTYYGSSAGTGLGSGLATYWPALDQETCRARQDLLLHVAPVGCQPAVVRSDLLAEQDVPVFCQLDALQLNPLLNIKEIRS